MIIPFARFYLKIGVLIYKNCSDDPFSGLIVNSPISIERPRDVDFLCCFFSEPLFEGTIPLRPIVDQT